MLYTVSFLVDELKPFVVETNASDFAISATLNQERKPVSF